MELIRERDALMRERAALDDLLASVALQWKTIGADLRDVHKTFGKDSTGRRAPLQLCRGDRG